MWGTAGMGVDYRDAKTCAMDSGNMNMVTNLQLMPFGTSLALLGQPGKPFLGRLRPRFNFLLNFQLLGALRII